MLRSGLYLLIIVGLTGLLTAVLVWTGPESRATLQPQPPQHVVTAEVREIDFQPVTRLTGQLQPVRRARIRFEVSGQLRERHVEPGHKVAAGDALLEIESGDYQDAVTEAESELQQERNALARDRRLLELMQQQVELQRQEVERIKRLGRDSLASKSNYDTTLQAQLQLESEVARLRHNIASAPARLNRLQAAYNRARRNLERTRLLAPFAATVDEVAADVGDYVTPGEMAVKLVQLDELDLALDVPAALMASLDLGQNITVTVNDQEREGRIVALAADPDPQTHTYAVRVRLAADGLIAGQLAEAHIPGRPYVDAHVAPATAILHDEGETYIFTIRDDRLVRVAVKVLQRYKEWQVIEGVPAGTIVAARDVAALADGQQITVER